MAVWKMMGLFLMDVCDAAWCVCVCVCVCVCWWGLAASLTVINQTCHDFHQYKHLLPAHGRLQSQETTQTSFLSISHSLSFTLFQNLSAYWGSILRHHKKFVPNGRHLKGRDSSLKNNNVINLYHFLWYTKGEMYVLVTLFHAVTMGTKAFSF